jgi:hypothetical protein
LDDREVKSGVHYDRPSPEIFRFYSALPSECIEYALVDEGIKFLGERKVKHPRPWGVARFKKRGGGWVPRSRPPVRFDDQNAYASLEEWLLLSITRILSALGSACAIEVFSSLYATIDPWEALEHRSILRVLEQLSVVSGRRQGMRLFSLTMDA